MTDPTPTETLRAAATKLREMAEAATPGPWTAGLVTHSTAKNVGISVVESRTGWPAQCVRLADADLIATLGPDFAVIVADIFDREADVIEEAHALLPPAFVAGALSKPSMVAIFATARHVLGEEVPQIAPTHGQERPNPANVGTGEGAGLEGAQIGAREIDLGRPREGE